MVNNRTLSLLDHLQGNTIHLIQHIFICSQESSNFCSIILIPGTFISSVTRRTLSTFKLLMFFKIPALTKEKGLAKCDLKDVFR